MFLIVIGITFNSLGQESKLATRKKSYFGLKAGINVINSSHYNDGSHLNYGYQIGVTYTIPLSSKFSFQPELLFQSIGYANKYVDIYSNGSTTEENKVRNTYLQFPLNFKYAISKKIDFDFGPNISVILNSKETNYDEFNYNGTINSYQGTTNNTSNIKKIGLGMNLGTNYTIVPNLYTGFRYTLMIGSYQTLKSTMDNSIFALSVGYNFR